MLLRRGVAGIVHTDHLGVRGDHRPARVARVGGGVVLDRILHPCPVLIKDPVGATDDAAGEGVLGVAQREAGHIDVEPGADIIVVPLEIGHVADAVDFDHGQVGALGRTQDPRGMLLAFGTEPDLDRGGARDHVVVGHRDTRRVDDKAGAAS